MAKEFLWCGRDCDFTYVGNDGNINLTSGAGTVSMWVNTAWDGGYPSELSKSYSRLFAGYYDANNYLRLEAYRTGPVFRAVQVGQGTTKIVTYTISAALWPSETWKHIVVTWDNTGGSGACKLNLYVDGSEVGTATTNGKPMTTNPATLDVGHVTGGPADAGLKGFMDNLAIWNGAMTPVQVAALYAEGRRHKIVQADGTGTLTLLATFDGTYNADVAAGTATATITTATENCRFPDGATAIDTRFEAHFGTGDDTDRIPGQSVFYRSDLTYTLALDADHNTYWTTAATNYVLRLRKAVDYDRWPHKLRLRILVEDLEDDEYITIGQTDGGRWKVYNNRIEDNANATHVVYLTANDSYGDNDKFHTLDFYSLPGTTAAGIHYMLVNGAILVEGTGSMSATGYWAIQASSGMMPTSTVTVKIESLTIYGPTDYQESDTLFDDFLGLHPFVAPVYGTTRPTGKVWRWSGLERTLNAPTKYASNPIFADGDAWVETWCDVPWPLFQTGIYFGLKTGTTDTLRFIWSTRNLDGTRYLIFSESANGYTWTSDAENPIMDMAAFQGAWGEWDRAFNFGERVHPTLIDPYGNLVMPYHCGNDTDGYSLGLAVGAADDYSFTAAHKYSQNPVLANRGHGDGRWYNRDLVGNTHANPWPAADDNDAFLQWMRGKTKWEADPYATTKRHLLVGRSCDLRQWGPYAPGQEYVPAWGSEAAESFSIIQPAPDRFVGFIYFQAAAGLGLITADSPEFFELTTAVFIPKYTQTGWETNLGTDYRPCGWVPIGENWLLFYMNSGTATSGGIGLATIRKNGLANLSLSAGQTSGWFESGIYNEPATGWEPFLLNANCNDGTVTVSLLDPDTGAEVSGYGAGDMDAWNGDHVEQEVTWGGVSMSDLADAQVRVKVTLARTNVGDTSPYLYCYSGIVDPSAKHARATLFGGEVVR